MAKKFSRRYDSYYDTTKDIWLESVCSEPDCEFCATRPSKPSEMEKPDDNQS